MYDSPSEGVHFLSDGGSSGDDRIPSSLPQASSGRERASHSPSDKVSKLPQPRSHSRSKSVLDSDMSKSAEMSSSGETSKSAEMSKSAEQRTQSKLVRPKAISRSQSDNDGGFLTDSTSSSRESSTGRGSANSATLPRSKIPGSKGIPRKAEKRSAKDATRVSFSEEDHAENRHEKPHTRQKDKDFASKTAV